MKNIAKTFFDKFVGILFPLERRSRDGKKKVCLFTEINRMHVINHTPATTTIG